MENTLLIHVINEKALGLLHQLEELHLIKILKEDKPVAKPKLSDKYWGIISKEQGEDLNEHIKQIRSEWEGTSIEESRERIHAKIDKLWPE